MNLCKWNNKLTAWLLDELPESEAAAMHEHIKHCAQCRAASEKLRSTLAVLNDALNPSGSVTMLKPKLDAARRSMLLDIQPVHTLKPNANWFFRIHPVFKAAAALVVVAGIVILALMPPVKYKVSTEMAACERLSLKGGAEFSQKFFKKDAGSAALYDSDFDGDGLSNRGEFAKVLNGTTKKMDGERRWSKSGNSDGPSELISRSRASAGSSRMKEGEKNLNELGLVDADNRRGLNVNVPQSGEGGFIYNRRGSTIRKSPSGKIALNYGGRDGRDEKEENAWKEKKGRKGNHYITPEKEGISIGGGTTLGSVAKRDSSLGVKYDRYSSSVASELSSKKHRATVGGIAGDDLKKQVPAKSAATRSATRPANRKLALAMELKRESKMDLNSGQPASSMLEPVVAAAPEVVANKKRQAKRIAADLKPFEIELPKPRASGTPRDMRRSLGDVGGIIRKNNNSLDMNKEKKVAEKYYADGDDFSKLQSETTLDHKSSQRQKSAGETYKWQDANDVKALPGQMTVDLEYVSGLASVAGLPWQKAIRRDKIINGTDVFKDKLVESSQLDEIRELDNVQLKTFEEMDKYVKPAKPVAPISFNPFVMTAANNFSTFAIDVDTASYTLTRQAIRSGNTPAPEKVRTEEIVNAFDYGDKAPRSSTFRVYQDGAQSPFGAGLNMLRIGVKGRRLGREEQRPAILTFVVDTSGSMAQPDRIGLARQALTLLVGQLSERDRIQIIAYNDHARLVLEPVTVSQKERILKVFSRLQCNGSTNLEEGLQLAYTQAVESFVPGAENRVILISDGVANLGAGSAQEILDKVASSRRQGITCSVFGVGSGTYNDRMLEELANKGDGVYKFLDSADEVKRAFVDELSATLNTIAKDAKIQVEWNPKVVRQYRQLGYENRALKKEQFRDNTVDAGEVGSGQSVTAMYELELMPGVRADAKLGTVRVRYQRTDTGRIEEIETTLKATSVLRPAHKATNAFRIAASAAEFAEQLRGCPHAAGAKFQDVADYLRPAAMDLTLDTRVKELLELVMALE